MPSLSAARRIAASPARAEALWYDLGRRATFIDGFHHVVSADGWPAAGGVLIWQSVPGGRGRVLERVTEHVPGGGQVAEVQDGRLRGLQRVGFRAAGRGGTEVTLELRFRAAEGSRALARVTAATVQRRRIADALARTLARFARELECDPG